MEQFKRAKIFVLETKQPPQIGDICYISVIGWFICTKEHLKGNVITNLIEYKSVKVYKMYITEYKEIEDEDYFVTQYSQNTFVLGKRLKSTRNVKGNKIIAILGNHIYPPCDGHCSNECICTYPQPSSGFVKKWIEEANKDNIITDVLVEYENIYIDSFGTTIVQHEKDSDSYLKQCTFVNSKLKINPKDNTITIKKVKEIYTKKEVYQILEKYTSFLWSEVGIHYPISLGNDARDKFINCEL